MDERDVRDKLGVSQSTMKKIRVALQPGGYTERSGVIVYTDKGLLELEARMGIRLKENAQDARGLIGQEGQEKTGTEDVKEAGCQVPAKKTAVVTNSFVQRGWMNPRLISATVDGAPVRVRVKPGALRMMRPGMVLQVTHVQAGLWECNQMPKAPGRMT